MARLKRAAFQAGVLVEDFVRRFLREHRDESERHGDQPVWSATEDKA